jgi:hypothetical protein
MSVLLPVRPLAGEHHLFNGNDLFAVVVLLDNCELDFGIFQECLLLVTFERVENGFCVV